MLLIEVVIEPRSEADRQKLNRALPEMAAADPAFGFAVDRESGQAVIKGVGEWQLSSKVDVLRETYKIAADIGALQVAYRETLGRKTEIVYTHKRQTGGSGQFAHIKLVFEPTEPGAGYSFENKAVGGSVPDRFVPGVEQGLLLAKENGLLAGFPVVDFKASLVDGAYHDLDSSVAAFEIAARAAFCELRSRAAPKLLEPIMKVEVTTPKEYASDLIDDLTSRRCSAVSSERRGGESMITALVPLANIFGYEGALSHMTHERAKFRVEYDHYGVVPPPPDPDPDLYPPAAAMRA